MSINDIPNKRKLKAERDKDSLHVFYEKVRRAVAAVNYSEKSKSRHVKSESRRQFIIALVTALEVYISDTTNYLIDKSRKLNKELDLLSTEKYTLKDVYDIKKNRISIGELVISSRSNNFQNLYIIDNILSKIFKNSEYTNKDNNFKFFEFLKNHIFFYKNKKDTKMTTIAPRDIFNKIDKILQERHIFVHDIAFKNTPSYSHLSESRDFIYEFVHCIEILANGVVKRRDINVEIENVNKE